MQRTPAGALLQYNRLSAGGTTPVPGRPVLGAILQARVPSLINSLGLTSIDGVAVPGPYFNENMPLRDGVPLTVGLADGTTQVIRSPVVNTVVGAMALQEFFEHGEWAGMPGDAVAYAPHLRKDPLPGVPAKSVVIVVAKGDETVPNPGRLPSSGPATWPTGPSSTATTWPTPRTTGCRRTRTGSRNRSRARCL
jgi:hypothetical protein